MLEQIAIGYLVITIVLEILDIIFFFTPSPNDDLLIEKVKHFWFKFSKYFLFFSARTPIIFIFSILVLVLEELSTVIKNIFKKKGS